MSEDQNVCLFTVLKKTMTMREGRDGELRNLPERRMKEGMYICLIVNLAVTFWPSVVLHLCTNWWSDCRPCPEESLEVNI